MITKKTPQITMEFLDKIKAELPPVIAKKEVQQFLGGMIASQTLANADRAGEGPEGTYRVGKSFSYQADFLLKWIVKKIRRHAYCRTKDSL